MKTVLKISHLPVPDLIQRARQIVVQMTGNANFTTPSPTLANITGAANAAETAYEAALDGGKTLKAVARAKEQVLRNLLTLLASYVDNVSQGDTIKILSSGMFVKSPATAHVVPAQPVIVKAVPGVHSGEVRIRVNRVAHANTYKVEANIGDGGVWQLAGIFTQSKMVIDSFTPHSVIRVRVTAIGPGGTSQVSDDAEAVVR